MTTSEINLIATLQNEIKELIEKNNHLKKELEYYKKTRLHWRFSFSIRNIFK